jgi:hypothetical protein
MLYTEEAHEIICEAYTYGYPLVLTDLTRQLMTTAVKGGAHRAPLNQFVHSRSFSENVVVGNLGADADALHSSAWLNVAKEPIVLSVPDIHERYYCLTVLDGWTIAVTTVGTRTTGNRKGHFALVGPRWSGHIPPGIRIVESPTGLVRLVGRTQSRNAHDHPAVHAIQREYTLTPLSSWGQDYIPPRPGSATRDVDLKATPSEQVARMDASTFFGRLNALMADNPPRAGDATTVKRFAAVGVGPGRPFELRDDPVASRSIDGSVRTALARIVVEATKPARPTMNGWQLQPNNVGPTETDPMRRAVVAHLNLVACMAEDTVTFHTSLDASGARLTGAERYVIRFDNGELPPVKGYWSVALHTSRRTFVPNALDRHAISSLDELARDAVGAVSLLIQHDPPRKHGKANWLPAPKDQFTLTMRLHWPQLELVGVSWTPPLVERIT